MSEACYARCRRAGVSEACHARCRRRPGVSEVCYARCTHSSNPVVILLLQIISKTFDYNRSKILKEIDIFYHCQGHSNILQLNEFYEESEKFYLVFNRLKGGQYRYRNQPTTATAAEESYAIVV